jgi:hypothetical protein
VQLSDSIRLSLSYFLSLSLSPSLLSACFYRPTPRTRVAIRVDKVVHEEHLEEGGEAHPREARIERVVARVHVHRHRQPLHTSDSSTHSISLFAGCYALNVSELCVCLSLCLSLPLTISLSF